MKYGTFPSINVPLYFNKGHIYSYIVTQTFHSDEYEFLNEESGTTEKPSQKAKQFVDSGHLEDVQDACDDQFYYAKCHASYKDVIYLVSIKLNKYSGAVACGSCECCQSNLGKCSHVTALLEFIWRHVSEVGYNAGSESCTSRLRQWGLGTKHGDPGSINVKEYPFKRLRPILRRNFDPRPVRYERQGNINSLLRDLQTIGSRSVIAKTLTFL